MQRSATLVRPASLRLAIFAALALLAAACTGSDGDPSSTPTTEAEPTSEATPDGDATTTPSGGAAPDDAEPVPWDPDVAAQLAALEAANDGQWTIDTALQAVELIRPQLAAGATAAAPVDLGSLTAFLLERFDEIDPDRWDALVASPTRPSTQLIAFQPAEDRAVYQDIAERTSDEFFTLTNHRLNVPIYVAFSDFEKPYDLYAATFVADDDVDAFGFLFDDNAVWQQMADAVTDIVATSGEVCVIVLGQELTRWDETRQVSAIMHEVTHCHQIQVHPFGRFGFNANKVPWMDEGYAVWAGEAFTGGTLVSRPFWNQYLRGGIGSRSDGFQLFAGDYRAHGFYSMLAAGGVNPWDEFVVWFNGLRANHVSNIERYQAMIAGADPEVVAGWTASASRNDTLGAPWNSDHGPGIELTATRRTSSRVDPGTAVSAAPAEQRYVVYDVFAPADEVSLIKLSAKGLGTLRWEDDAWNEQFTVTGTLDRTWCVGEDCVCEDGTSPAPDALLAPISAGQQPTLHAALLGAPGTGAQLDVSIATLEDACEEPEPSVGPLDSCLFGIWNPDPQQFQDLVLRLYRGISAISGLTLEGTIDLTFYDDGTFFHTYNGVKGTGIVDGVTYTATWSGGSFGTWEASGGVMSLTFTGSDIAVTLAPIPIPSPAPPIPTATVEATYDCRATNLVIDPPPTPGNLWPIPEDWTKVGSVAPLN
jgi:hypothetical protein